MAIVIQETFTTNSSSIYEDWANVYPTIMQYGTLDNDVFTLNSGYSLTLAFNGNEIPMLEAGLVDVGGLNGLEVHFDDEAYTYISGVDGLISDEVYSTLYPNTTFTLTLTNSSPAETGEKFLNKTGLAYFWSKIVSALSLKADTTDLPGQATDSTLGLVKLNPNESVGLNVNGQLQVGGRLGQFPNGGVFYPTTIEPINVGGSTFLITDGAVKLSAGSRQMIIAGGNNLKLKGSHPAGSTEYHIQNTLSNRFGACAAKGGRLALTQASAAEKTVAILSIKVNGQDLIAPYSGATDNTNDIIITVDESLNPDSALANNTNIRPYGNFGNSDVLSVGQLNGTSGGKVLEIGMQLRAEGNQVMLFGNGCYSNANNSVCLGHSHINNGKQFATLLGQGHDTTNGRNGVGAVGMWSVISSDTMFVVGKGTDDLNRSNAFEVTQNGSIKTPTFEANNNNGMTELKMISENGTEHLLIVTNEGQIQIISPPDPGPVTI